MAAQTRIVLWIMLLTGIMIHSIVLSNINISMPVMVNRTYHQRGGRNSTNNAASSSSSSCPVVSTVKINSTTASQEKHQSTVVVVEKLKGKTFNWTETQQNIVLSSHYSVYGLSQLLGGYLAHRYGPKLVWGYSTLFLGFASFIVPTAAYYNYTALIVVRILQGVLGGLGIAGGPALLVAKWVPPYHRAKYMITMLGIPLGMSFSYSAYGFIIHWYGWEYTFYISGAVCLIWCIFFYQLIYDTPTCHPKISVSELKYIKSTLANVSPKEKLPVPWKSILTSKPYLVNVLCKIGVMWCLFTLSVFTPIYFTAVHGLSIQKTGLVSGLPFFLKTVFATSASVFTDYLIQKDVFSKTNVRKLAVLVSSVIGGILLLFVPFTGCNTVLTIVFLAVTMTLNGGAAAGIIPNIIDISPNFTGVLEGIAGFLTSFTGFLSPIIVGYMIRDNTLQQWNSVFMLSGIMYLVPGVLFLIYADSEPQPWNDPNFRRSKESQFLEEPSSSLSEDKQQPTSTDDY